MGSLIRKGVKCSSRFIVQALYWSLRLDLEKNKRVFENVKEPMRLGIGLSLGLHVDGFYPQRFQNTLCICYLLSLEHCTINSTMVLIPLYLLTTILVIKIYVSH